MNDHGCDYERPCLCAPHPDLLTRLRQEQIAAGRDPATKLNIKSGCTGTVDGLNDGIIFSAPQVEDSSAPARAGRTALERTPLRGDIRVVVILVDFDDKPMAPNTDKKMEELFFSTGKIATGSVTEYYTEVSNGLISMSGEVLGPYRMPRTMTEYAHGSSGFGTIEPNIRTLGKDAVNAVKGKFDFKPYDNDGNGHVDAFVVVHAGSGAEVDNDKNKIWSVQWAVSGRKPIDVGGVGIFAFLTIPEDAFMGVCVHELGHLVFGWPDLYDGDDLPGERSAGIGSWCLMASGSWAGSPAGTTPTHPSAWCKATQGWVQVINENENHSIRLKDVKSSKPIVHRLWKDGDETSNEYFLLENRQQTGFDRTLPGNGLLVWHIDDNMSDNNNEEHFWVALEQADGLNELGTAGLRERGDTGDPFPGDKNKISFTSDLETSPNSRSYTGEDTFVSVTNISKSGPSMKMNITVQSSI